ncbi:MAG TPA: LpqB family beta-propeller domain-containing protein [Nocardioides sp.]|uniref:LpqB family beta-propeller domain-containing protein n=1 Tax=Nocardioides sp. TaxID=35761 RepID=UPI002ED8ED3C
MTRRLLLAALPLVALLTAGCVSMPTSGRVVETGPTATATQVPGIAIDPRPPVPGASALEVVQGFLDAMLATPLQTRTAQQFLAADARSTWNPSRETIIYAEKSAPQPRPGGVVVELTGVHHLDARGAWLGALAPPESELSFRMAREDDEWRIAEAPDALIVPDTWFESRFAQAALYFFDPSGHVLVPEPVFVPRGSQVATALVRGLVQGPGPELAGIVRSYLPAGVGEGLSVPVSEGGVAEIALTGGAVDPGQLDAQTLSQLTAQLAWTLRQEPTIRTVRLSVDGRPVQLPNGRDEFSVQEGPEFDPAGYQTSPQLFGLSQGLLVAAPTGQPARLTPVQGPFGTSRHGLRSVAVDLPGKQAAGVTAAGTLVLHSPVQVAGTATVVARGRDLLRPAWDIAGRLWLVDRTARGAQVSYVRDGRQHQVRVPGITGSDVRRFLVSRDGTRIVALVRGGRRDTVVLSRLRSDDAGRVVSGTAAVEISGADADRPARIADIAWSAPTAVLVLHQLADTAQVRTVSVDGAVDGATGIPASSITVGEVVDALVSSPVPTQAAWGISGARLLGLVGDARDTTLGGPVVDLGYVG